jgi:hypothetical protein
VVEGEKEDNCQGKKQLKSESQNKKDSGTGPGMKLAEQRVE